MDDMELKKRLKDEFDAVSDSYAHLAMRLNHESAKQVSRSLNLKGDVHVLDVATGTGHVALALAKELPDGRVTGIDFSEGMLAQAARNKSAQGIDNVTFTEMDMQAIDYPDQKFDAAVVALSIFFIEDMKKQLIHIANKVKDGGMVLITTYGNNAFVPLLNLFANRLKAYDIEVPDLAWKRLATKQQCTSLYKEAGLQKIKCEQKAFGYYLKDSSDWWCLLLNRGFRGLLDQLSKRDFVKFKEEHLAEVKRLESEKGIWLDLSIIYTVGEKKA